MIEIDGSEGEGGGQVLRTALSLSCITNESFKLTNIRANRKNPGLANQHMTAVLAAAGISRAQVIGNNLGSTSLEFMPKLVNPGRYSFDIGTAGSTALVLQSVLPALMLANGKSQVTIKGGTDNKWAPTMGYMQHVYIPVLSKLGVQVNLHVRLRGFYPRGGGEIQVAVEGGVPLRPVALGERGDFERFEVMIDHAQLPPGVAENVAKLCKAALNPYGRVDVIEKNWSDDGPGSGIGLCATAVFRHTVLGASAVGERGLPSPKLASEVCDGLLSEFKGRGTVDIQAADQLLLPLAIAPPGSFFTVRELSGHAKTNINVIGKFLGKKFKIRQADGVVNVETI